MIHEKRWPLSSYISHWWAVASGGWSSYFGWAPLVPCDVDWKRRGRRWLLGNCHAAQISNRDTVSFSLSKNHSCLCDANTLSTFVWSTVSQQLLLAEGWFLDSDIKADRSAFGCQRKLTMLFSFFFPRTTWENTQSYSGRADSTSIWARQRSEGGKQKMFQCGGGWGISARGCGWEAECGHCFSCSPTMSSGVTAETRKHVSPPPTVSAHCYGQMPVGDVSLLFWAFTVLSVSAAALDPEHSLISSLCVVVFFLLIFSCLHFPLLLSLPLVVRSFHLSPDSVH